KIFPDGADPTSIVKLWDYRTGLELKKMELPPIGRMAICNKGEFMVAALESSDSLRTWDIKNWTAGKELSGNGILAVAFSPTEMVVAATSNDFTLRTWDIGETVVRDDVSTSETDLYNRSSLSASHDGNIVVGIYQESETAQLWNISEQSRLAFKLPERGYNAEVSPDGRYVACGIRAESGGSGCVLYDTKSLERLLMWEPVHGSWKWGLVASSAVFSKDSKRIMVSAIANRTIRGAPSGVEVWDIHTCKKL
ncbi:hypothetical protein FS837_009327, partial [Tulasnella sp. UAMH 9824]